MAAFLGRRYKGILGTGSALGQEGIILPSAVAPAPTYLLDFYTGAAAAYSVRRLSSSYSGSALRVRRSSDNAEQDIGFVGENLDTSALTTFVGANDGFVVTWYDQSGNGNHATQTTAADQPQIVASGSTLLENGKPVIQPADGTDHLETTVDGSANTWNFSVIKFNVAAGIDALYNATGTNTSVLIADAGQTTPSINGATYSAVYADGSALATTTRDDIATATTNQALVTVSVNDSGLSNISLGYDLSTGVAMFNMQEFIYYTSDQSANRTAIESNLNTYYTITSGPVNTVAPVISGTAERGETLTSTTGTWTGTGIITYTYQWKRNGSDISGATSSTYVLVAADDNANITCLVTATDVGGSSSQLSNTLGPVLGSPYLLSAPVASGTAQVGQTLSTTNGSWQGIATITFTYQWRRDTVDITGATASTYVLVADDYATDVDCVVTATNGLGSASADSNDIANIAGIAPIISGVPTISSETQVGQTITATPASATGTPTPTTSWQWQRSSDGVTGWANISGATASTYTLVAADDTKYVRAVQTETNAVGSDSANSAASSQIVSGVAPVISGVPTISSENQVGETITATPASVTGTPTPTTTWQWQRSSDGVTGWADISGATSSTYTLVVADDTKYVRVVQTETNALGSDSANSVASSQVVSYTFGNALLVDGTNDYATPSSPINTTSTEFVISLWFRSTATGGGAATGFIATQSTESDGLVMANLDRVRIKLDGTSYDYSYSWSNDSDWHHYYWYRDSSGALYLCIDGGSANLLSSGASGGITFDYLFRRGTSNTINLNGTIDDFYIAETTGSAANAASVYNSGNGANPQTVHSNNGVAFYQFNESSGSIAADSSGNGNDLTLTNFSGAYFLPHSYDADTSVYLAAASITDTTEQAAVNQLVLDLKGTGSTPSSTDLWTDAAAFYPISPTSLSAAAYNLRDTTTFNMTWANSPTHASTGVTFDGLTQYGDTGFNPSTESLANGYDITLGVEIVNANITAVGLMAGTKGSNTRTQMLFVNGNLYQDIHNNSAGRWVTNAGGTYQGRMIVSADRVANGGRANYLNGTSLGTKISESNGTPVNVSLWTGAQNDGAGGGNFTALELSFGLIIPKGLDATAIADLDDAIARYNTTVLVSDPDAAAYIASAGITSRVECEAVNQLVKDLKGTGSTTNNTDVWSDIDVFNPISPTSLSAASYNLKDPATFQTTWVNSPTHTSSGVVGNGTTQYGDTNFNPSVNGLQDDFGVTMAINTNVAVNSVDMGVRDGTTVFNQQTSYFSGSANGLINQIATSFISYANANTVGVYTINRTTSTSSEGFKDGVSKGTTTRVSVAPPNGNIFVMARNLIGTGAESFTTRRLTTYAIHKGLSSNQSIDIYDAINKYNTALSR